MQAGHATAEHAYQFGRPADHHPTLLYLTIRDKEALEARKHVLHAAGIKTCEFHEPYKNWGLTAISCLLTEDQRHLLSDLPLWKLPTQEMA